MPTPISGSSTRPQDLVESDATLACTAPPTEPEPNASGSTQGDVCASAQEVEEQLYTYADLASDSFAPEIRKPAPTKPPPSQPPPGYDNASRTTARAPDAGPYAAAGIDSEHEIAFAGAALLKSHDPVSHIDVEVMSASGQVGMQNEVQIGLARIGASMDTDRTALGGTIMAIEAHAGVYNPDGSLGFNIGASATAIDVGATYEGSYEGTVLSASGSVGLGAGAGASIGTRDGDLDGRLELCVSGDVLIARLGACVEKFW